MNLHEKTLQNAAKWLVVVLYISALVLSVSPANAERNPENNIYLRIIIAAGETDAKDILAELAKGRPFAFVAKERSVDDKSRNKYGELEPMPFKNLEGPLKKAISGMKEGDISGAIRLQDGRYAIVHLIDLGHYRKGAAAFRTKDYNTAEAGLLKHTELNPDAVKARVMLGKIYENRKSVEKAEGMYKEAISYDPKFLEAYVLLGASYMRRGMYQTAKDLYEEGLKNIPDAKSFEGDIRKAEDRLAAQKVASARPPEKTSKPPSRRSVPLRIIIVGAESEAAYILSALRNGEPFAILAGQRSVDKSKEEYGYLGEVEIEALDPAIQAALSNLEEGQTSGTIRLDNRYAFIQIPDTRFFKEGEKAFVSGDFDTAEKKLLKHIELNPETLKARAMLGKLYEDRKEYKEAEEMYKKALLFNPETVLVYERLARLYVLKGDYLKAKEVYADGLKHVPSSDVLAEGLEMTDILLLGKKNRIP